MATGQRTNRRVQQYSLSTFWLVRYPYASPGAEFQQPMIVGEMNTNGQSTCVKGNLVRTLLSFTFSDFAYAFLSPGTTTSTRACKECRNLKGIHEPRTRHQKINTVDEPDPQYSAQPIKQLTLVTARHRQQTRTEQNTIKHARQQQRATSAPCQG